MAEATSLVKYIAASSVYSRRKTVELIKAGHVTVNGTMIVEPWHEVHEGDDIRVAGKKIMPADKIYILLNKPAGYITTMADEAGRPDVATLIKKASKERLFPIGRLDKDTTGLLLFTNDGHLAQRLSHPRFQITKEYQVTLDRPVDPEHLKMIFKGVYLKDGKARVDRAILLPGKRKYVALVEIHSGKKRVIRRLFEKFDYEVRKLDRIGYAGLAKKGLSVGKWRVLTKKEIASLQALATSAAVVASKPRTGAKKPRAGARARTRTQTRSRTERADVKPRTRSKSGFVRTKSKPRSGGKPKSRSGVKKTRKGS